MKRVSWLSVSLIGVTALWGWSFVAISDVVRSYAFLGFLAIRFMLAAGSMAPFVMRRMTKATFFSGLGIGAVLAAAYFTQTLGLRYTTASNSALLTGMFMVLVPICDWAIFRRRPHRDMLVALGFGFAGAVMLAGHAPSELQIGDVLTLLSAGAFSLHISLLSRYSRYHDPGALTMAQMLAIGVSAAVAWPFFEPLSLPTPAVWWTIIITALLGAALGFYVQTAAQRKLPGPRTAVILTMEPLFGVMFGYLLAGDRLTPLHIGGAAMILAALTISEVLPTIRRKEAPL